MISKRGKLWKANLQKRKQAGYDTHKEQQNKIIFIKEEDKVSGRTWEIIGKKHTPNKKNFLRSVKRNEK